MRNKPSVVLSRTLSSFKFPTPVFFSFSQKLFADNISVDTHRSMGSMFSSPKSREQIEMALAKAKQIVSSNPVVVFSKTYCGYCQRVKQLFSQIKVTYKVIELDEESDGDEIQTALAEWTGQRTVPNVFINGKHIGGSDVVANKHQQGQLLPLLAEAGAIAKSATQL